MFFEALISIGIVIAIVLFIGGALLVPLARRPPFEDQ